MVKNLPAMQNTQVRSLGWEDLLEKGTHSSILAWRIPWTEEPGGLQSTGSQRVGHNWVTSLHLAFPFSRRSSQPRDRTQVSRIAGRCFTIWATREGNSSWVTSRWCCESAALNMPANLENLAVATGLEKASFHSNPKERNCQRMLKLLHNYIHLTR